MNGPTRLLAIVFFASGFTGLVYQVAWQRILTIPLGVGALSITLIVSVYMLGLGIGSFIGGKIADRALRPYLLYALIEAALGAVGFASVPVLNMLEHLTTHVSPATVFLCNFIFLCCPTVLMGITLPLLTAIFSNLTGSFTNSVSRLYFLNTLGASIGALVTGYICAPLLGLDGSIYAASGTDWILAILILVAGSMVPQTKVAKERRPDSESQAPKLAGVSVSCLAFIAGFLAIGYEVIWYRVIGILVKDSPYSFATILAVYLLGIALGSFGIQQYLTRNPGANLKAIFYSIQFLIGATVLLSLLSYYYLSESGPLSLLTDWSFSADVHPSLDILNGATFRNVFLLTDVFLWPLFFLFIPSILMGAGLPLIASVAFSHIRRAGSALGLTYFFVLSGNVLGGLVTGLLLLPYIGTEATFFAFGICCLLFGILPGSLGIPKERHRLRYAVTAIPILIAGLLSPSAGELYARMHRSPFLSNETLFAEGLDSVVLTYTNGELVRNFINGQGHGYRPGPIFYAEALEALSLAPKAAKVLVVGFGAGSIVEAALMVDDVQEVIAIELCQSSMRNLRQVRSLGHIFEDRKLKLVIDDGREFLQRHSDRYDIILMDPLRTTTAYSNNIHSRQFFALARKSLNPTGIVMVGGVEWNPVIPRTLMEEFAYVRSYPNFCLASDRELGQNEDRFEELIASFPSDLQFQIREFRKGVLEGDKLRRAVSGRSPNDDWHPVSEYFLGPELRRWSNSRR